MTPRLAALPRRPLKDPALHLAVARTRTARARGLAGLDAIAPGEALLLERCRCVHTFHMRFAIDLIWLDAAGAPVRTDLSVPPRRVRACRAARAVIEAPAGGAGRLVAAL